MTEIQKYLAEEVAEDLADGIITRREAMRRLGLLGVTGAAAAALLAAFASTPAPRRRPRSAATAAGAAPRPTGRRSPTEAITFAGPRGTLMAAWAAAEKPRGGVLVIHENRGLTEHISTVAGRFAASGYSALALDLLSEEGGTGAFPGEAEVAAALAAIDPARFDADMQAGVTELGRARPAPEARRDRLLLRRRHGLAPARLRRARAWPRPRRSTGRSPRAATSAARAPRCSASTAGSTRA